MDNQPQIWHYGLVARSWAELERDPGPEGAYFQHLVEHHGQPALDLGCGTGRLLLPMVKSGLDVDGSDLSEDMLALCQERALAEDLSVRLYAQPMHLLDLPRRYKTIFACGVVGLGGDRKLTQQAMHRAYDHLRQGGCFAFDYTPRWNDPPAWMSRLPENRRSLPQEWPESGERDRLPDGTELEMVARTVETNALEETAVRQIRARLYQDGKLLKEEIHTQHLEDYSKNELVMMLERAGFQEIKITGDYTDEPATQDHGQLVFIAIK